MIEGTLQSHPDKNGILFKGFPRTLVQAYILDGLLRRIGSRVNCILDIRVPTLELIKRLAARAGTPRAMPYDRATDTIVRRLEETLKERKGKRYTPGLLVHCLRNLDLAELEEHPAEEDYRRYVRGKYAEFIQP